MVKREIIDFCSGGLEYYVLGVFKGDLIFCRVVFWFDFVVCWLGLIFMKLRVRF